MLILMAVAEVDFIGVSKVFQKQLGKRMEEAGLSPAPPKAKASGTILFRGKEVTAVSKQVTSLCVIEMGGHSAMQRLGSELGERLFDGIVAILKPNSSNDSQLQGEVFRHVKYPSSIRVVIKADPRTLNPEVVLEHLDNLKKEAETKSQQLTPEYLEASKLIRNPANGRLDAIKIAKYFAMSLSELATIVDLPKATLHKTPDGKKSQAALEPFEKIARLRILMNEDDQKVRNWLNTPNEELAKVKGRHPSPMDIIRAKHPEIIAGMVERAFTGEPS